MVVSFMVDSSSPQGGFHVAHNFGTAMPFKLWEESISSVELSVPVVTGRAFARPAPPRPAASGERWISGEGTMLVGRRTMIIAAAVAWMPLLSAELPVHYLNGHVCSTKSEKPFHRAGYPCKHPLRGVTITAHTASGERVVATTDHHGAFALPRMELWGTDDDYVQFQAPKYESLRVSKLRYPGDVLPDPQLGATVFLRKHLKLPARLSGADEGVRGVSK
jgi:hypothetical protein